MTDQEATKQLSPLREWALDKIHQIHGAGAAHSAGYAFPFLKLEEACRDVDAVISTWSTMEDLPQSEARPAPVHSG